jgi:hypothetical protein
VLWRVLAVLVVVGLLATPLVLHFTQRRHNQLELDLDARFPNDRALVGGEVFATTLADVVEHELRSSTGWRPNDFLLWGPKVLADNNANRQLGIIQAVRESARVFKDHLTKVSSDPFDENLVAADTAFRNDAEKLWLPSAESKYAEGVWHLPRLRERPGRVPAALASDEPPERRAHPPLPGLDGHPRRRPRRPLPRSPRASSPATTSSTTPRASPTSCTT